jgi:photosystem II stability/assembly factor-like uncharacterized protein
MKAIILTFISLFILLYSITGQWEIVNEGIQFNSADFISKDTGWLAGGNLIRKTTDGGKNWILIQVKNSIFCKADPYNPMRYEPISINKIDFINDSLGYAIANDRVIIKTVDGGQNWIQQTDYDSDRGLVELCVVTEDVVYAIGSVILKTSNGGSNWVEIYPPHRNTVFTSASFLNADTGLVEYSYNDCKKIMSTSNAGETWDNKIIPEFREIFNVKISDDSTLYFLASDSTYKYFICKTTNMFSSWSIVAEINSVYDYYFFNDVFIISVNESSGSNNILKSIDGGLTWEKAGAINWYGFVSSKIYVTENVWYIIGTYNTFIKSVDQGNSWTILNSLYPLADVCFINRNKGFVVGGVSETHRRVGIAFLTIDGGKTWRLSCNFGMCAQFCYFTNDSNGYINTRLFLYTQGRLYQTLDGGDSWLGNSWSEEGSPITDIFFVNNSIGYLTKGTEIFKTTNSGISWNSIFDNRSYPTECKNFNSVFFIDDSTGWAVGEVGIIYKYTTPETWKKIVSGTTLPLNKVLFTDRYTGWIAGGYMDYNMTGEGFHPILLKTENEGESWSKIENENYLIHDLYFRNNQDGWAVGEDKNEKGVIIATDNGGIIWNVQVDSLSGPLNAIHFKDGIVWAVGDNGLILKTYDSTFTSMPEHTPTNIHDYNYLQNFPNPFHSRTIISYRLPVISEVELSVYDLIGRKVNTLMSDMQPEGNYEIEWNAEGIKPGIYFCELKAGQSRKVIKMILLK